MGRFTQAQMGSLVLHVLGTELNFSLKDHVNHDRVVTNLMKRCPTTPDDIIGDVLFDQMDQEIWQHRVAKSLTELVKAGQIEHHRKGWCLKPSSLPIIVQDYTQWSDRNVTTAWLTRTLTPEVLETVRYHVGQRCTKSMVFDEVVDLVDNYFAKLMFRDGLSKYLSEGKYPSVSQIKLWAYRASLTQFRDEGRDALTRSFKGARTERDLADNPVKVLDEAQTHQAVYLAQTEDGMDMMVGTGSADSLVDIVDALSMSPEESYHQMGVLETLRRAIRKKKSRNPARYERLFDAMVSDTSSAALAAAEGISVNRASTLKNEIKDSMLEIVEDGRRIRRILHGIQEEPYTTWEEVETDIPGSDWCIRRLITNGLLESIGDSLLITRKGSSILEEVGDGILGSVSLYDAI